ncbi:MAG TPA: FtsX-like permease family protein, partial [Chitinophagaceae bacterium]|nr:FtsX-like permease family protein [Chitinophagaceae bacterium]
VAVYVRHSLIMDKFSNNVNNVYRIETAKSGNKSETSRQPGFFNRLTGDADKQYQLVTHVILAEDLKANFPEVKEVCRIKKMYEPVIKIGTARFKEDGNHVAYVDKNFFSVFDLPVNNAQQSSAFAGNSSAVISEQAAKKYFGNENPVGKIIELSSEENQLFTISAIAKNFPSNSSMQFDVMIPVEGSSYYADQRKQGINTSSYITVVQLYPGTAINAFKKKLAAWGETYFNEWRETARKYLNNHAANVGLSVRPFSESHYNRSTPWFYFTDLKSLYQLILLAVIAIAIACLNYVLLSLSRVATRSHEAGVRRTVGASWKHIINMLLTETFVMVMISVIAGFVIAATALPYFNSLTGVRILVAELFNWKFLCIGMGIVLLLTLIAGIYPALKMADIRPLNALRKFSTYKLNPSLSKIFITLQYTACIVLIVFSIVIAQQVKFVNNKDLGFDKEQTIVVTNPWWGDREKTMRLQDQLRTYASTQPAITNVTGSTFRFGKGFNMNGHFINGEKEMITEVIVDYDYFEFSKIPLVKGRYFSRQFAADTARLNFSKEQLDSLSTQKRANLVINETLYQKLGQPALNEFNKSLGGIIIGVCKDYFYTSLQQKIGPLYHICRPDRIGYTWLKIAGGQDLASVIGKLKSRYNDITNGEDFSYSFTEEDVKAVYESHVRWMKIIQGASWMAIFIACLGLFGLSAIVAVNKTKEIGIRKVLGANVSQLFYSLNRQTLAIVLLSIIIAVPVAVYVSDSWLQDFAYRIRLSWIFFVIAAFIGLLCALIAVSYHTIKAATVSPVKSLRTE